MTPGTSQDGCEGRRVQSAQLPEEVEHRPPAGEGAATRPTDRGEGVTDPPSFSSLSPSLYRLAWQLLLRFKRPTLSFSSALLHTVSNLGTRTFKLAHHECSFIPITTRRG